MTTPNEHLCPPDVIESFIAYRDEGIPPSVFVRACLENNLSEAFGRADEHNRVNLQHIVAWLYWNMPSNLWKSREAVNAHLKAMREPELPERDEPVIYNRGELPPRDCRDEHDKTL